MTMGKNDRFYDIDGFLLDLGEEHPLPETQRIFPMYDRLIPYLGKLVEMTSNIQNKWIIDIGANVGDTVAAIVRHTAANILCVEPTSEYFAICEKNISRFGKEFSDRIHLVKAYVAENTEDTYVSFQYARGTAVKVKTDGVPDAPTYTIPSLLKELNILPNELALIKVDTDGYDAECVMSLGEILQEISPYLYWENQIDDDDQLKKYLLLIDYLEDKNYTDFFCFDNFGNYLTCLTGTGLKEIDRYLARVMHQRSAQTFPYVDVLACKADEKCMCEKAIGSYLLKMEHPILNSPADYQSEIKSCTITDSGFEIVVKNSGSVDWSYDKQVKIGLFSEGKDTGIRRSLPIEKIVKPGEAYAFTFFKEQYEFFENGGVGVRMLQEGVAYWGEYQQIIEPRKDS